MSSKQIYTTNSPWEDRVGYSRAVRVDNIIEVAGTTAVDKNGAVVGKGDAYEQTRWILENIEKALLELGASMHDVVRTRMYVTDIAQWEAFGKAHGEFFREVKPAATMVEVSKLIHRDMLIEIEATAIIQSQV